MGLQITPVYFALNQQVTVGKSHRGLSSADRAARIHANPARLEAMRKGRTRLAAIQLSRNQQEPNLATLRLAAGLSQADLAQKIGMLQPNLARLEKRPGDPACSTLRKLAEALCVSYPALLAAIDVSNRTTVL